MRKHARIIIGVLVAVIILGAIGIVVSARRLEPRLRQWVISTLSESLDSEVTLGSVRLTWLPLELHGNDLTIRHRGRTDIPPVFVITSFGVDLHPTDLWSSTLDVVHVDGLEINIPPKDPETGKRPIPRPKDDSDGGRDSDGLVIRHLVATNTRLAIIPRSEGKNPKVWDIHELAMKNIRGGETATFTAALINPIPYGEIEAKGTFGPWQSDQPGNSPIAGEYSFAADLGTIEGLGGQLTATGAMDGTLDQIATRGETHTPDFRLTELDGGSLPLETAYDALVDGTKGDVELRSVDVQIGKSKMHVTGVVEGTKGVKGKRVVVNLKSKNTDLGEMLRLVSKRRPAAEGRLAIDAAMDLPQGTAPILERIAFEGSVRAQQVKFTNALVQEKIDELSRKGQGRPKDDSIDEVASKMATQFVLNKGVFTYRALSFNVQGAGVRMDGTHSLRSKTVDLNGVVLLNATVSQTQTGFKSWLLKPFDPLFKKNGAGTRLVIKVAGTQDQPKVGLDFGKTIRGK